MKPEPLKNKIINWIGNIFIYIYTIGIVLFVTEKILKKFSRRLK